MGAVDRTCARTNPWINFHPLDLQHAPFSLWMLLGEAQSKIEHIAGVPLRPTVQEELHKVFLAKGIHATTAIEGNTLSEEQVKQRLEGKLELPKSQEYLGREIDNMIKGYNLILADLHARRPMELSVARVKEFNRLVLEGLDVEPETVPGEFRQHSVVVGNYRGAPAEDCPYLTTRLCEWLNSPEWEPPTQEISVAWGLLKAIMGHLYLAWIHGFGDGNGRTARLVEYQLIVAAGVPTPAGHLLSSHYNQTRSDYYLNLSKTSRGGTPLDFVCYSVQGFVDQLRLQLDVIREQQMDVVWLNYVHQQFDGRGRDNPTKMRRRHLVIDMSRFPGPVARSQLPTLTTRLARDYATKTDKTLTRDLNAVVEMGLVRSTGEGYVPARELILAFLPERLPAN